MDPSTASGSCLCGDVSFEAPMPARWVAHCHCTRCRRAHGAAFVTWVSVDDERTRIDDSAQRLRWFDAGQGGQRGFCSRCGSPMFFRGERWPGELHIARALFHEPLAQAPMVHGYWDTHVSWVQLADNLPRKPAPQPDQGA
jgi:hypothetical protein